MRGRERRKGRLVCMKSHMCPTIFPMGGYGKWENWKGTAADGLLIRFKLTRVG